MNISRLVRSVTLAIAIAAVPITVEGQKAARPLDVNPATILQVESGLTGDVNPDALPPRALWDTPNIGFLTASSKAFSNGRYYHVYRIEVRRGAVVWLTARSTAFDTYIAVFNPDDTSVKIENDDFEAGSTDSRISLRSGGGEFYIVVSSYEPGKTGRYTLQVQLMDL